MTQAGDFQQELHELLSVLFDSELTSDQTMRLNDLLTHDEAYLYYIRYTHLRAMLHWSIAGVNEWSQNEIDSISIAELLDEAGQDTQRKTERKAGSEQPRTGLRIVKQPSRRMLFLAIAASLLLAFFGIGSLMNPEAVQEPASAGQGAVIAVCRVANSLKWSDADRRLKPGDVVRTGRFALESGELRVETFDGAALTLNGPCDVSFESADRVVCHHGHLFVDVLRDDANLVIATPAGEVLHYGTVFSVNVVDSGATELSVFDGSVGLCSVSDIGTPESSRFIFSGNAIRVETSGKVTAFEDKSQRLPDRMQFNATDSNKSFHPRPIVVGPAGFDVTYVKSKKKKITCLHDADLLLAGKISSSKTYRASDVPWIDYQSKHGGYDKIQRKPYLNLFDKNDPFPGHDSQELNEDDDNFAIRATAQLIVPDTWLYSFAVVVDDGARLRIDGQDVIVDDGIHHPQLSIGMLPLQAGIHAIELVAYDAHGLCRVELGVASGRVRDMNKFRLLTK